MRSVGREVLLWAVLLLALYVILIGPLSLLELAVGAGLAVLGALAARGVRRVSGVRVDGLGRCLAALRVWPVTCVAELVDLVAAVVRALRGRPERGGFRTVRLRPGVGPARAATLLSSTPGAYVLDADDREMRVRALDGTPSRIERVLSADADEGPPSPTPDGSAPRPGGGAS
ncbi:Na+/H+ antiporter subunit E [Streptomyces sp. NPDC005562]|uniref:Na+/H+ antiporter subunit E n=1 Tax=unclassified Streptomyces TaxID=2593676 RepID=UPI0033AFE563